MQDIMMPSWWIPVTACGKRSFLLHLGRFFIPAARPFSFILFFSWTRLRQFSSSFLFLSLSVSFPLSLSLSLFRFLIYFVSLPSSLLSFFFLVQDLCSYSSISFIRALQLLYGDRLAPISMKLAYWIPLSSDGAGVRLQTRSGKITTDAY